mmetsp:Transcript_66536/g.192103  ORF Transcript_66536/g.192103 Transcript_66536/m.192103 type:complete len:209 (+) Transcript_66536:1551-2177(+)
MWFFGTGISYLSVSPGRANLKTLSPMPSPETCKPCVCKLDVFSAQISDGFMALPKLANCTSQLSKPGPGPKSFSNSISSTSPGFTLIVGPGMLPYARVQKPPPIHSVANQVCCNLSLKGLCNTSGSRNSSGSFASALAFALANCASDGMPPGPCGRALAGMCSVTLIWNIAASSEPSEHVPSAPAARNKRGACAQRKARNARSAIPSN